MSPGNMEWHGPPGFAEVEAHANRYEVGVWPVLVDGIHTDWTKAPKARGGRWLTRRRHWPIGKDLRASQGWLDPEHDLTILVLVAYDGRVWLSANGSMDIDLATTRWAETTEFRPLDKEGNPVRWPEPDGGDNADR